MAASAYAAALRLLSRRDYFAAELADRLAGKGFDADDVAAAVSRCAAANLIDDERTAARFVELRVPSKGWGPHRISAELRRRGVADELAERAGRLSRRDLAAALESAVRRAEVRARDGWWRLPAGRSRMVSSLIARGFAAEDAIEAVRRLVAARENPDDALDDQ